MYFLFYSTFNAQCCSREQDCEYTQCMAAPWCTVAYSCTAALSFCGCNSETCFYCGQGKQGIIHHTLADKMHRNDTGACSTKGGVMPSCKASSGLFSQGGPMCWQDINARRGGCCLLLVLVKEGPLEGQAQRYPLLQRQLRQRLPRPAHCAVTTPLLPVHTGDSFQGLATRRWFA